MLAINHRSLLCCESLLKVWHEESIIRVCKEVHADMCITLDHNLTQRLNIQGPRISIIDLGIPYMRCTINWFFNLLLFNYSHCCTQSIVCSLNRLLNFFFIKLYLPVLGLIAILLNFITFTKENEIIILVWNHVICIFQLIIFSFNFIDVVEVVLN